MKQDNRDRLLAAIPANERVVVDNQAFFASSLFVRGRALGVIYADAGGSRSLQTGCRPDRGQLVTNVRAKPGLSSSAEVFGTTSVYQGSLFRLLMTMARFFNT